MGWKKSESAPKLVKGRMGIPYDKPEKIIDVYIFDNPKIVNHSKNIGVRPKNHIDYQGWCIKDGTIEEKPNVLLSGIGIKKDCLYEINEELDLYEISRKLGIGKKQLEYILSN